MANLFDSADVVVAKQLAGVVDAVIVIVVAFMLPAVVLLSGGVAVVDLLQGHLFEIISGWLLTECIVTMLAKHIATNIISQMITLQV